jgi:hypothetical protein
MDRGYIDFERLYVFTLCPAFLRTPPRVRWDWLEGTVPFLLERGPVPIGGTYTVAVEETTLDGSLKQFIKRATANWVAALLEESGVVVVEQGARLAVRLASGTGESLRVQEDCERDHDFSAKGAPASRTEPGVASQGNVEELMQPKRGPGNLSDGTHRDALLKRRIKFVVEKGAMARLFKRGTHGQLQAELSRRLRPSAVAGLNSRGEFDQWLYDLIQSDCWEPYSRNGLAEDRWA